MDAINAIQVKRGEIPLNRQMIDLLTRLDSMLLDVSEKLVKSEARNRELEKENKELRDRLNCINCKSEMSETSAQILEIFDKLIAIKSPTCVDSDN